MAKRKKKQAAKRSRSRAGLAISVLWTLIIKTGAAVMRLVFWLIVMAGRAGKKNPLAALGLCGFFLTLTFVGINALFQAPALLPERVARPVVRPIVLPLEKPTPPLKVKEDELAKIIRETRE